MKKIRAVLLRKPTWFLVPLVALLVVTSVPFSPPANVSAQQPPYKCNENVRPGGSKSKILGEDLTNLEACEKGYEGGYKGDTIEEACGERPRPDNDQHGWCRTGHGKGAEQRQADGVSAPQPTGSTLDRRAATACKESFGTNPNSDGSENRRAKNCITGYKLAYQPDATTANAACTSGTTRDKQDCREGFRLANRQGNENRNPTPAQQNAGNSTDDEEAPDCDVKFLNPLTWVVCPFVDGVNSAIEQLDNAINSMLTTDTNRLFGNKEQEGTSGYAYYKAWDSFRKIALGIIFVVALIILIATAFGYEILDAYTIRKTLPRALIAVLLITLSWSIMSFLINITNDIGNGVRWLIYSPFQDMSSASLGGGATFLTSITLGAGALALGIIGLLAFAATALIAVFTAFAVLIIRELGLEFLTVIFPIAIACMILPGTQKLWNVAKSTLISLLVVFPIIAGMIAIGRVFSKTIYANGNASALEEIVAYLAYIIPYFMLPFAFKMAGGVMATMGGLAQARTQGMMKGLSAYRGNKMKSNLHAMKEGNRFKSSNPVASRFNKFTKGVANAPNAGVMPHKWRSRYQAGMSQHSQQATAEYMEKSAAFKAIMGNDDYLQATMRTMGGGDSEADWRRYLSANGYKGRDLEQGVAMIRAAKRDTDDHTFKRAAVVANASTGTGWKEGGAGDMMASINEAAGGDRDAAAQMLAEMRGRAERARRVDLHGAGFGGQMADLNAMNDGKLSAKEATRRNNKKALELQDARTIAGARGDSMKLLAPEMMEEVKSAYASGNDVTIKRSLARAAALYDNAQYSSAENAELIADQMLAQPTGRFLQRPKKDADGKVMMRDRLDASGNKMLDAHGDVMQEVVTENAVDENGNYIPETLRDQIETYRDDREFLNMRRELSSRERMAYGNREAAAPPPPPEG